MYLGTKQLDDSVTLYFQAVDVNNEVFVPDSAPTYRIYEGETPTPILTGTMSSLDEGNIDGFYSEQIVLSAANGFEQGKSYHVLINYLQAAASKSASRDFCIQAALQAEMTEAVLDAIGEAVEEALTLRLDLIFNATVTGR